MKNKRYYALNSFALSVFIVSILFIWQGNKGFNIGDEGFLWYGAQRVLVGEVPIRDFMAYDPGRYYWSAALMYGFGDNGIMALRLAVAAFQVIGLFIGVFLVSWSSAVENKRSPLYTVLVALILVMWMFPRHKIFDISLSLLQIGVLAFLIENPTTRRYFISGFFIGLVAVFGRNHGMYGSAGSLGVMLWLSIKREKGPYFVKGFLAWSVGVVVGFIPILLMVVAVPGFFTAFLESVKFLFEVKETNLPLPIPWPWTVNFAAVSSIDAARGVLVGLFFIATLVFGCLTIAWVLLQKFKKRPVTPALVATAFLSLPYAHYAFSRADVGHLAQGIFPLLMGCLLLLSAKAARVKWPFTAALCAGSLGAVHIYHPGWQCHLSKQCVTVEVSGNNLQITPDVAGSIALLRRLAEQYAPNGQSFIATPFWPGAYALLERRSPMWEIYALFPRSEAFEKMEIDRIQAAGPGFALVLDIPLDGRDELRFKNTHPLANQYIMDNFILLSDTPNQVYQVYKSKYFYQ